MICYLVRHGEDDETIRGGWSQQIGYAQMLAIEYESTTRKERQVN